MPIPIEVIAAQMALSHPDEFTEEERAMAERVLNEWHEVPCPQCANGWDGFHARPCLYCDGSGKVWVKHDPS